jgi:hypothetical protein
MDWPVFGRGDAMNATGPDGSDIKNSNDRVPVWMVPLGIKEGEWFIDSKARAKRAMTSKCFSPAARLHIWLGLATMGFQTQLATKMETGRRVPATPKDACAAVGIRREHFHKHFKELESMGLAECRGSTKGRVELYGWALPRPVDVKKIVTETVTIFDGCPSDLAPLLKRYRVSFPPGFVTDSVTISELQRLAQVTFEAESSLRKYADCLRGGLRLNKEESNGKEPSKETTPASGRASQTLDTGASEPEPPDSRARPQDAIPDKGQNLKTRLRAHLLSLTVPSKLQESDFERIAAAICDERTFDLFKRNTKGRDFHKWTLVLTVAEETHERAATYPTEEAQAVGAERLPRWAQELQYEREHPRCRTEE